jgi:hypothetical protein
MMEKRDIPVFAASGEELDRLTQDVAKIPAPTLALIKSLLRS